jgi:hypothetical protein
MAEERAFALPDGVQLAGGSLAYGPDGETVDVKQLLADNNGLIRTDDPVLAGALGEMHLLEERALDGGPLEPVREVKLDRLRKDELLAEAVRLGIEVEDPKAVTKADLIAAINATGQGDVDLEQQAAEQEAAEQEAAEQAAAEAAAEEEASAQ